MDKKTYINIKEPQLILTLIVVIIFLYLVIRFSLPNQAIILTIDFGNGEKQVFYNDQIEQEKAWNLLQQAAVLYSIDLEANKDFYPRKIDGVQSTDSKKIWTLYVNGIKQNSSPLDVEVKKPDKVLFKLE
ncbi:MAG: DUF4430 domain-containing protein [Patescibacteria group bacterium]